MDVDFVIKNYRRFSERSPARFSFRDGSTAFLGVNNAGKSSLLRLFYDLRELFKSLSSPNSIAASLGRYMGFGYGPNVRDLSELFAVSSDRDMEIECVFHYGFSHPYFPETLLLTVRRNTNTYLTRLRMPEGTVIPGTSQGYSVEGNVLRWGGRDVADLSIVCDFFSDLGNSVFLGAFRNAIDVTHDRPYFDINVGRQFVAEWRRMKNGSLKSQNEMAISVTASIREIFGLDNLEINASDDATTLQLIINGRPFTLAEVGSGMAHFILTLANAAARQPRYIFIDEPELSLHPSLQLKFLSALESFAQRGIFFATHNLGLARSAADRIYSVYATSAWESRIDPYETTPRLSELLGELSYAGYRDLGYRKILLVEGPTELRAISALLQPFGKDGQVVLLSMNGTNLINGSDDTARQLEEMRRMAQDPQSVSALIDSERTAAGAALEAKREGFRRKCTESEVGCHVLERRSLESYFTDSAVKRAIGDSYRALGAYEDRRTVTPIWSKHHNWKIAREMKRDELTGTDLGDFLERL